jgi:hypothetical protein
MTVGEYHEAQRANRQRMLAQLLAELVRAREQRPDWYVWIEKRRAGVHDHGLKRADGSRACCPVDGCDVVGVLG